MLARTVATRLARQTRCASRSFGAITRLGTDDPRMSQIVVHNETVYLSGQVPADFDAGLADQVTSTLGKVDALLESVGSDKSKLLSANIWRGRGVLVRSFAEENEPETSQAQVDGRLRGDERHLVRLARRVEQARARVRRGADGAAGDPLRGHGRRGQVGLYQWY